MPTLSNAGTYNEKVLQPAGIDFNKRPPYTRAKLSRCTRANQFESGSQTQKTTSPVYKRATSFRYCTCVENWLYVCRHGSGGSFLCLGTWLEVACFGAACQFCKRSVAFLNLHAGCRTLTHATTDCRLTAILETATWGKRKVLLDITIC